MIKGSTGASGGAGKGAAKVVRKLVNAVEAIRDHRLHGAAVARFFAGCSPGEAVEALRSLITAIDEQSYRATYHGVVRYLHHDRLPSFQGIQEVYRAAHGAKYQPVQMLLLRAPALLRATAEDVLPDPNLREVPLGRRKSMARGHNRELLTRLVMDPSPSVVTLLLQNPLLLDRDVVRMAARRPNMAAVLELIGAHARWSQRYDVQQALVHNPYSPASLAAALVPFLRGTDLYDVGQDARIHAAVRECGLVVGRWRAERQGRASPRPALGETH